MARAATHRRKDRATARMAISSVRTDLLRQAIPRMHRHSPGRKHRMQQRREVPPSKLLAACRKFPRAGQLPKQSLRGHKLACHASSHAAEDGSWTCPTCGDCFDDSAIDQQRASSKNDMPNGTRLLCTILLACHFTCICCNAYDGEARTGQDLDWLSAWQIHA